MWKNLIHQHQAKPISASSMLRENNWVVRDNKGFSNASNLESLSSQMLVLAKRYDPKKKGKPATLKDIAIAEIDSVSLDEGGVAYLKIRMHVKQRDDAKKLEDINAVMKVMPFYSHDNWGERISFPEGFREILRERTFTCLAYYIGQKADDLLQKVKQENRLAASAPAQVDNPSANDLNSLVTPQKNS